MSSADKGPQEFIHSLISRARGGSDSAFGKLLEDCRPYLLLVANEDFPEQLRAKMNPSDLVQDTFLKAHRQFVSFRGTSEEELRGWLRKILRNHIVDCTRTFQTNSKRDVSKELTLQETPLADLLTAVTARDETPSKELIRQEWREQLHKALEQLPEDSRQLIRWRNYELLSFQEIGDRLGCSRTAARNAWTRAIQLLTLPQANE